MSGNPRPQSEKGSEWNTGTQPPPSSTTRSSQPARDRDTTETTGRSSQRQQPQQGPPRPRHTAMSSSKTRARDAGEPTTTRLMQPHGVAAIGPSASNLSSGNNNNNNSTSLQQSQQALVSIESPLPPVVQRSLGDRSNEKRKNAALEIEALVKSLQEANNMSMVQSIIQVLSKDFCTSMNS
jgi:hypothetical protein